MNRPHLRLAILSSHPIQYNAPLFAELAARNDLQLKVFYSWRGTEGQDDPEFGRPVQWDVPLTTGYDHAFIPNVARAPGTHHFRGLDNPGMNDAIAGFAPDALLVYGWPFLTHLRALRRFHGRVPVLFRGDSTLISSAARWKRAARRLVLRWVYRHVDWALYPGERSRAYFETFGIARDRLIWAPHAIDNARFAAGRTLADDASHGRVRLGMPEDAVTFLFAGKLVPRKQPDALLRAFISLTPNLAAAPPHLVLVGTGPMETALRKLASESPASDRIHFLGFKNQSEMPAAYRLGDVFVLPSSRETWGLAVNEAMASSRPVIVSDRVGCAPDLVAGHDFGEVFALDQPGALQAALSGWSTSRAHALEAGRRAANAIADWSIAAAADAMAGAAHRAVQTRQMSERP